MKRNLITGGALAWALMIFLLSSRPATSYEDAGNALDFIPALDFFVHFGLYFVLAVLVHAVLRTYLPKRKDMLMFDTVVFALLYGVSDEFHQSFVPGRTLSGTDLLADVLGAVVAVTLWLAFDRIRKHRQGPDADGGTG
jgi:VanZ family protein